MKVYIIINTIKSTGKFSITEIFDNSEEAMSALDYYKQFVDKEGPYRFDIVEHNVKSEFVERD